MISPDIDADAARVHAAEESAMELFVGYGGPRDPTDRPCCDRNWMPSRLKRSTLRTVPKFGPPPFQWIHPLTFIGQVRTGEGIG